MSNHGDPLKSYFAVFLALLVLTAVTTAVAFVDFGAMNNVVALSIASLKALLVVLIFMHVRHSSRVVWAYAGAGILWLVILFALMLTDYRTRHWVDGWS